MYPAGRQRPNKHEELLHGHIEIVPALQDGASSVSQVAHRHIHRSGKRALRHLYLLLNKPCSSAGSQMKALRTDSIVSLPT